MTPESVDLVFRNDEKVLYYYPYLTFDLLSDFVDFPSIS